MEDKQILIIGDGQLGGAFKELYPKAHVLKYPTIDLTDDQNIRKAIGLYRDMGIKAIINTAAYTDVDGAEKIENFEKNLKVNALALIPLQEMADELDAVLVHFSSDYVFDGEKEYHCEDERSIPRNQYGVAKKSGDYFAAMAKKHYIVRISWLIGDNIFTDEPRNFVKTVAKKIDSNQAVDVVVWQYGRLTFCSDVVLAVKHLLDNNAEYGIYNVSGDGPIRNWFEYAKEIRATMGEICGCAYNHDMHPVNPKYRDIDRRSSAEKMRDPIADRPHYSTLCLDKIKEIGFEPANNSLKLREYIEALYKTGYLKGC